MILIAVSFSAGIVLGCLYFGGLWLTVRVSFGQQRPVALLAASTAGRLAALGGALYFLTSFGFLSLVSSFVGLLGARWFIMRRVGGRHHAL